MASNAASNVLTELQEVGTWGSLVQTVVEYQGLGGLAHESICTPGSVCLLLLSLEGVVVLVLLTRRRKGDKAENADDSSFAFSFKSAWPVVVIQAVFS